MKKIGFIFVFLIFLLTSCGKKTKTEGYIIEFEAYKNMGNAPTSMEIFCEGDGKMESVVITDEELCNEIADIILKNYYTLSTGDPFPGSHTPAVELRYGEEVYRVQAYYLNADGKRYESKNSQVLAERLNYIYNQYKN